MVQIIPAILATTEQQYKEDLEKIIHSESFDNGWVHIDFADNKFVQNQTIGLEQVNEHPNKFKKEAHLMVANPLSWLEKTKEVGFDRVIIHFESEDNITDCLNKSKKLGLEVGLALNLETAIEQAEPFLDTIDLLLIMTIVPGFQGQNFSPKSVEKIKTALALGIKSLNIGVDGHINDETVKVVVDAGATHLVVGSYLLQGDFDENLEHLWEKIHS